MATRFHAHSIQATFFVIILLFLAALAVYFTNNGGVALVARSAVSGTTSGQIISPTSVPGTISPTLTPPITLHFFSNLPDYTLPQSQLPNDLNPVPVPLQLTVTGMPPGFSFSNASVAIDQQTPDPTFVWNASTSTITFPNLPQEDHSLGEGTHTYSFSLTSTSNLAFHFSQSLSIDRTPPRVATMTLSSDRKTLTFTIQDPPGANGAEGSGLDHWNSSDVLDSLNVELIQTTGNAFPTVPTTSTPNPYTLEAGLPDQLTCGETHPGDDHELSCTYPFSKSLPLNTMPVVFVSDDAGNRIAHALLGNYATDYEESILLNNLTHPRVGGLSSLESDFPIYFQGAPSDIVFDLYILHTEIQSPDFDQTIAEWTFPDKVTNTLNAAADAATYWQNMINTQYPGHASHVSIGKIVGVVPQGMNIPSETQVLLTQTIHIPSSEYPSFFTSNCDFDAQGYNFNEDCIQRINPCDFIGCTSQTTYWGSRHIPSFAINHAVNPKDPIHVPVVVTDYLSETSTGGLGGFTDLVNGNLYLGYGGFVNPTTHHFRPGLYTNTLAHEMGHALGLGHTDDSTNIMDGESFSGSNLDAMQVARVQAGLTRAEFKPPALGVWYTEAPQNTPYFTDCGPSFNSPNAPGLRLLDWFSSKREEVEAPYSGKPLNATIVLTQNLQKKYCPLVFDGQDHVIQPAPEAVDSTNVQAILAQYPGAVIKQAKKPECTCVRDAGLPGNGTGSHTGGTGPGGIPTGGGGGGSAHTKEPKGGSTDCGKDVPGYTLPKHGGDTFTISCPDTKCPAVPAGQPNAGASQKCQKAEGDSCGNRAFVEIQDRHFCCKCQPAAPPTQPLEDAGANGNPVPV